MRACVRACMVLMCASTRMQNVLRIVQHKPLGAYLVGGLGIGVTNRHLGSKVRVILYRVINLGLVVWLWLVSC